MNKGMSILRQALNKNSAEANAIMGEMFLTCTYFNINEDSARHYLQLATKMGSGRAYRTIGDFYLRGPEKTRDYIKAKNYIDSAMFLGDAKATALLAYIHSMGYGVPENIDKAITFYNLAIQEGYIEASYHLAKIYHYRLFGVKKDLHKAMTYYLLAADRRHGAALNNIGLIYEEYHEYITAIKWYAAAAEEDYYWGYYNIGSVYQYGYYSNIDKYVKPDLAKAYEYYDKAAEQGLPAAIYKLGDFHYYGRGVKKDRVLAVNMMKKAAKGGEERAINFLKKKNINY